MGLQVQNSPRQPSFEKGFGVSIHLRRAVVISFTAMLALGSVVTVSAPVSAATSLEEYLGTLTDLCSGPSLGQPGRIAFTLERCLYVPESDFEQFAEAAGLSSKEMSLIRPPRGSCFLIVDLSVENLHLEPFVVEDVLDFRLEDAGGSMPGWDVCEKAQEVLSDGLPPVMAMEVQPHEKVRGYAVFSLPEGTKNLWYAGYCKIGAVPEKKYVGSSRGEIGELPGDEPVQPHRSGYKVVVGSFCVKANALRWAEEARARGLSAWVQEAYEPKGLYVVLAVLTDDYRKAADILYLAKERGYSDAYIIGRPAT